MKTNRNFGSFENTTRRRGVRLPIVPIVIVLLIIAFFWVLWARGGEKPQQRIEKAIPAEQLGK